MDAIANNYTSIIIFLISGILGTVGQGISVWVALNDLVYNKSSLNQRAFVGSYISGSTFIGFITGLAVDMLQSFPAAFSFESVALAIITGFLVADIFEFCRN